MPTTKRATAPTTRKGAGAVAPSVSIAADEVVVRGTPIVVTLPAKARADEVGGIAVQGRRARVTLAEGGKTVTVDTTDLPTGSHRLLVQELPGAPTESRAIGFHVVETGAPIPAGVRLHHAARLRFGDLDVARLPMEGRPRSPYVDVFKGEDRRSGEPVELAFGPDGRPVRLQKELEALAKRRRERFGKLHPDLVGRLERTRSDDAVVPVAVWLRTDDDGTLPAKPVRAAAAKRPALENRRRATWAKAAEAFRGSAERHRLTVRAVEPAAPVVFADVPASEVRALAERDDVAAVFLHDTSIALDLGNSIAIAESDDAHSLGFTGKGVRVAVYEDGPDDTTNLVIDARYTTSPATSQHARHTHGIVKNKESGKPHGHAPDCSLSSANSQDLAAIRWAAQDRECTVISQSFHRDAEQTSSTLSFDDVFKDHLALHYPYPTICEAAGNGASTEFVNHKGFNRLTVGNHNDAASAMASDSVMRNPSSAHGDRELPEIAANGVSVTTVGLTMSGTSMAAPAVAGATALIQQAAPVLKSWPEGCRAVHLAAAWRNPAGSTWHADLVSGADGADGAGALDAADAVRIAQNLRSPGSAAQRRGFGVGTVTSSKIGTGGWFTDVYRIAVPATLLLPHVKVALAWDSAVTTLDFLGIEIPLTSTLAVDLDLHVVDSSGTTVASSSSWDNSYEIVEFTPRRGEQYTAKIRRWSGTKDVWYGIAWQVTGLDLGSLTPVGHLRGYEALLGR